MTPLIGITRAPAASCVSRESRMQSWPRDAHNTPSRDRETVILGQNRPRQPVRLGDRASAVGVGQYERRQRAIIRLRERGDARLHFP